MGILHAAISVGAYLDHGWPPNRGLPDTTRSNKHKPLQLGRIVLTPELRINEPQ